MRSRTARTQSAMLPNQSAHLRVRVDAALVHPGAQAAQAFISFSQVYPQTLSGGPEIVPRDAL